MTERPSFKRLVPAWLRAGWGVFGFLRAPLKTRLIKGLGIMLLPLVILGGVSYYNLHCLDVTFRDLIAEINIEKEMLNRMHLHTVQAALMARYYEPMASTGKASLEEDLSQTIAAIDTITEQIHPDQFALEEEDRLITAILTEWQRIRFDGLRLAAAGQRQAAVDMAVRARFLEGITTINQRLQAVLALAEKEIHDDIAAFDKTRRTTQIATLFLFGTSLAIAVIAGILLAGSILRPLAQLEKAARALGNGDLSVRVETGSQDELALLMRTFNQMAEELEESHQTLTELTIKDPLTNLYNRREFARRLDDEIDRVLRYGGSLGLFLFDLDHFKQINDRYGHQTGDQVLRQVADLVRQSLRRIDILFRYGGEEFVALLPEISPAAALQLARRLRQTLASTPMTTAGGETLQVTLSIGLAFYPTDAKDADTLIRLADEALYRAKQSGRNCVCSA